PVAAEIGEAKRGLVENLEKARRATAVLHIGPTGLRNRGHIERVSRFDERRFFAAKAVERAMTLEMLPHFSSAIGRLCGLNARGRGHFKKLVGHDGALRVS